MQSIPLAAAVTTAVLWGLAAAPAAAQHPDLSGSWKFNVAQSDNPQNMMGGDSAGGEGRRGGGGGYRGGGGFGGGRGGFGGGRGGFGGGRSGGGGGRGMSDEQRERMR